MAGLRGNQATLAWALQSAKGTPNTAYTDRSPLTGGNIEPVRTTGTLSETDANRDQGVAYTQNYGVAGAPEIYVRDANIHHFLTPAFGAQADSGAVNFTHTITPANALGYYTIYREIGGTLFEEFDDCMANELTISADAGSPLSASLSFVGLKATRLAAQPAAVTSLTPASGQVYNFGDVVINLAGGLTHLVSSFQMTLTNNTSQQQTDGYAFYDNVPGSRELTVGFTLVFETLAEYNRFNYGGTAGTAQSAILANTAANFTFSQGANNSVAFDFPSLDYEEFSVSPDPGGAPITVDVRARARRSASPICTATVKNQIAT